MNEKTLLRASLLFCGNKPKEYGKLLIRHGSVGFGVSWKDGSYIRYHKAHSLEEIDELNEDRHKYYWNETLYDKLKEKKLI